MKEKCDAPTRADENLVRNQALTKITIQRREHYSCRDFSFVSEIKKYGGNDDVKVPLIVGHRTTVSTRKNIASTK